MLKQEGVPENTCSRSPCGAEHLTLPNAFRRGRGAAKRVGKEGGRALKRLTARQLKSFMAFTSPDPS